MPLYHLVGALDPLTPADVTKPVGDGLPEHLGEWIRRDGLTHLKIKLNGDDLVWDVERVVAVNSVAEEVQRERGVEQWWYSLDFNERCKNVEYLLEFLQMLQVRAKAGVRPRAVHRTADGPRSAGESGEQDARGRETQAGRDRRIAARSGEPAPGPRDGLHRRGVQGVQGPVADAAARGRGPEVRPVPLRAGSDLPGASLIHSAGIAAHIPGVAAIESNGRQYCPAANAPWDAKFPGVFTIRDGTMNTAILNGPGLGAV